MSLRLIKAVPESVVIRGHAGAHRLASKSLDFSSRGESVASAAVSLVAMLEGLFEDDLTRDPCSVLLDGTEALVRHFAKHPGHLRLELHDFESPHGLWTVCARDQKLMGAWPRRLSSLERLLARGRTEGVFRAVAAADLYRTMVGGSMLHILGSQGPVPNEGKAAELGNLVRGLVERYIRF